MYLVGCILVANDEMFGNMRTKNGRKNKEKCYLELCASVIGQHLIDGTLNTTAMHLLRCKTAQQFAVTFSTPFHLTLGPVRITH
jgi:hypothetical protein